MQLNFCCFGSSCCRWLQKATSHVRPRSAPLSSESRQGSGAAASSARVQDDALLEEVLVSATRTRPLVLQQEQEQGQEALAGVDARRTRRRSDHSQLSLSVRQVSSDGSCMSPEAMNCSLVPSLHRHCRPLCGHKRTRLAAGRSVAAGPWWPRPHQNPNRTPFQSASRMERQPSPAHCKPT